MPQTPGHVREAPGRITTLNASQELILKQTWLDMFQYMGYVPKELSRVSSTVTSILSYDSRMTHRRSGLLKRRTRTLELSSHSNGEASLKAATKGMSGAEFDRLLRICCRLDNPDNTLLRFIRARKWDVGKALAMLGSTILWRKENNADRLISRGELLAIEDGDEGIMSLLKKGISKIHGVDKLGRPIVHVGVHLHKPKAQSAESLEKYTIQTIENARMCLREGIDTAVVIFDLSRFSLSNMDYHAVKYMADCFEAHYPESLGVVLIHKAPWIFSSIWKVIKNWLDPVVAAKIQFTTKTEDLLKFIDASNLDKELGGKREWTYKYTEPKPGDNTLLKDTAIKEKLWAERNALFDSFYDATLHWCKSSNDESNAWLLKKLEISKALEENFWQLDPYIRASSIHDRDGTFAYFHEELKDRTAVGKLANKNTETNIPKAIESLVPAANGTSTLQQKNETIITKTLPKETIQKTIIESQTITKPLPALETERTLMNGRQERPDFSATDKKSSTASSTTSSSLSPTTHIDNVFGKGLQIIDEEGEEDVFYDVLTW